MVVTEELVRRSITLGTWPSLDRKECAPSLIAERMNAVGDIHRIHGGLVVAIRYGIIVPSFDRHTISFSETYFAIVGIKEIGRCSGALFEKQCLSFWVHISKKGC